MVTLKKIKKYCELPWFPEIREYPVYCYCCISVTDFITYRYLLVLPERRGFTVHYHCYLKEK